MNFVEINSNRYVHMLCISIFFAAFLHGQNSNSKILRDSVESVDPFPDTEIALPIYQKINELSKKEGNRNTYLYSKIYISYFNDVLGNNLEANEAIEEAFNFAQDTIGINQENIILTYQLMQDYERKRGNLVKAIDINKKYIELELKNSTNDVQKGISYREIAIGFRTLGDLENAKLYSTKSFKLFKNAPDSLFQINADKNLRISKSLQIRGLVYKDLKNYPNAIRDYKTSLEYLKKSKHLERIQGIRTSIHGYNRITDAYLLNGDLTQASKSLQKLEHLGKNESYERYRYYELLAVLSLKKGELSYASKNLDKAIELANIQLEGNKEFPSFARLFMVYGDYYSSLGLASEAIKKYHEGLQYFDSNLDDNYSNNPDISLVHEGFQTLLLLEKKADTFIKSYVESENPKHLLAGVSTYATALELIQKLKADFINEGSKYGVTEIASSIFPKALEANFALYQIDKSDVSVNSIFNIIEKNKAEILFQNISSKYNLLASSLPKEMIDNGIDLKYNISYYSKLLSEENLSSNRNKEKLEKYKNKLFKLNENLAFHDQKIKDEHPKFYKFKNEIGNEISVSDLKSVLKDDQMIIEYFQTEDHMYSLSICKEKAAVRRISMLEIEPILIDYLKQISKAPTENINDLVDMRALSIALSEHLILEDENYHSDLKKIIIIPDGILNKIPFESLIIDEIGTMLIENSNVTYNYSASQFSENNDSPKLKNPSVLCLTPTFEGLPSEQRSCNATILGDLPYVKKEFDYLKSNFSGSFFNTESANLANLKDNFANYQIVHLATHACLNDEDPMLSQIYFSDGSMTSYDIQNLNSRPELVVLSACNTASGHIRDGEGVIGLSRGFFEAGVKGMQSSLWSIDDLSSSKIVIGMYQHLKRGVSKSEALRLSKLDYLKNSDKLRSHPYYWAAMIHIGNDNPISFSSNTQIIKILTILAIFILGIGLFLYFKRNSNEL